MARSGALGQFGPLTRPGPSYPLRPQDGYALSKYVGEVVCDALVRRADVSAVSVRPSLTSAPRSTRRSLP